MAASCRLLSGQLLGRIARGDAMRCHALAVENLRSSVAVARSRNFTALPNPRLLHRSSSSSLTSFHFESRPSAPLSHRSLGSHHHPLPALRRGFKSATPARQGSVAATHAQSIAESSSGSKADASDDLPLLTHPSVSTHLFLISGLVFAIVVVGGLTRLTESGLSITEWNLVTGTLPPLNQEQWMSEYNKYMVSPEGTLLNKDMTLSEFKRIYAWEWGHRLLGRVIGVAFLAPIPYFIYKRRLSPKSGAVMFTIATLIGGQGALGWYMVKSGLTHEAIQARDGVPRVSQYRLAAHLGMAFLVYSLALRHGITIRRDWALAKLGKGVAGASSVQQSLHLLQTPEAKRLRLLANGLTALVFTTAISGALKTVCAAPDTPPPPKLRIALPFFPSEHPATFLTIDSGFLSHEQAPSSQVLMRVCSTTPSRTWARISSHQSRSSTRTSTPALPTAAISTFATLWRTPRPYSSITEYLRRRPLVQSLLSFSTSGDQP